MAGFILWMEGSINVGFRHWWDIRVVNKAKPLLSGRLQARIIQCKWKDVLCYEPTLLIWFSHKWTKVFERHVSRDLQCFSRSRADSLNVLKTLRRQTDSWCDSDAVHDKCTAAQYERLTCLTHLSDSGKLSTRVILWAVLTILSLYTWKKASKAYNIERY